MVSNIREAQPVVRWWRYRKTYTKHWQVWSLLLGSNRSLFM